MFQSEKKIVLDFYAALETAEGPAIATVFQRYCSEDYVWHGFHPFNDLQGPENVAQTFWIPLKKSLSRTQRRMDVFMAGRNCIDGFSSVWVVSMGHLLGLFDAPWLGIRPTRKMALLRYAEFNRIENGKIVETAMYFDIPHLMMQAGLHPFPPQTAAQLVQPGPITHAGLLFDAQPPEEGEKTLALIGEMVAYQGQWDSGLALTEELRRTWHEDMIWWGPSGIGATYTIDRYAEQHAGPMRAAFTERSQTEHDCRIAEGHFGGFFGYPIYTLRPTGGFMGMPGTGKASAFRVIDIYRREGDKLAENWIFIDFLDFWKTQGVDILARTTQISCT